MEEYNLSPYHNHPNSPANVAVTPLMIDHLRATKPWVRFISIAMFVGSGFMILVGIAMMFMPAMGGRAGAGFGAMIGIFYILLSLIYIVPAYFLYQYASSIKDLLNDGGDVAMENALGNQKSFWRFVGILTLVIIAIYVLAIGVMILSALAMYK